MITDINKGRVFAVIQFCILISALVFTFAWHERNPELIWLHYSGGLVVLAGIVIAVLSVYTYGQMVTPNPYPLKEVELRTTGIYRKVRHPMYLGVLIAIIGWCMMFFSIISIFFPLTALMFLIVKINFEEKQLIKRFPEYLLYKEKSYRLFPYIY
jgi:protein-S-isoprenylcysteine O-methyltransferase Ste14